MSKYEQLIDLPHHTSSEHPRMSKEARAAQFAPFAALTGFEALVGETGRVTDIMSELTEDRKAELNYELCRLIESGHSAEITYFVPDKRKKGGKYLKITGKILRYDEYSRELLLEGGCRIAIDSISDITPYTESTNESEK